MKGCAQIVRDVVVHAQQFFAPVRGLSESTGKTLGEGHPVVLFGWGISARSAVAFTPMEPAGIEVPPSGKMGQSTPGPA